MYNIEITSKILAIIERETVTFAVKTKTGKIDEKKTARLKKKMDKACKNISATVTQEIREFHKLAKGMNVEEPFWRAACHRAMLVLHSGGMEVYLSAEFGDLFGAPDILEPTAQNSWVDVERIQKAKEKWDEKQLKRGAR